MGRIAMVRRVLVLRFGLAVVVWYPYAGSGTSASLVVVWYPYAGSGTSASACIRIPHHPSQTTT